MLTINEMDSRRLIKSLASTTCPACGKSKGKGKTLCYRDFCRLPGRLKAATYNPVGEGYEQAVLDAMNHLKVETFIDPIDVIRSADGRSA